MANAACGFGSKTEPSRVSSRIRLKCPPLADVCDWIRFMNAICAATREPSRDALLGPLSWSGLSRRSTTNSSSVIVTVTE